MEFFESYYLVERNFSDEHGLATGGGGNELVLEPFYESLELRIRDEDSDDRLVCVSGSMSPIPQGLHPALTRRGLDYVGVSGGDEPRVVLGVAQADKHETPYVMLLRALNCFAELTPPFRVVQLERELVRDVMDEDVRFDLHVGITDLQPHADWSALIQLTRDLAELFKHRVAENAQFSDTLGRIDCVEIDPTGSDGVVQMGRIWSV